MSTVVERVHLTSPGETDDGRKFIRITRLAVVRVVSEVMFTDEPEKALETFDRMVNFDKLLRNMTKRRVVNQVTLDRMEGADIDVVTPTGDFVRELESYDEGEIDFIVEAIQKERVRRAKRRYK